MSEKERTYEEIKAESEDAVIHIETSYQEV